MKSGMRKISDKQEKLADESFHYTDYYYISDTETTYSANEMSKKM